MASDNFIKLNTSTFHHHKWLSLRPSTQALWVNVLLWCGLNRHTEGKVHRNVLRSMICDGYPLEEVLKDVDALIAALVLEEFNDDWLQVRDWREPIPGPTASNIGSVTDKECVHLGPTVADDGVHSPKRGRPRLPDDKLSPNALRVRRHRSRKAQIPGTH